MRRRFLPLPRVLRHTARRLQWWAVLALESQFLVAVVTVVRTEEGRMLLLENRFWAGNRWGCPAGYMKHGETPERAAHREIREECGIAVTDVRSRRVVMSGSRRAEIWCTARTAISSAPTTLQRWEISDAVLLPIPEALRRMRQDQAAVVQDILRGESPAEA